ncbi:MAG: penicillin acylase family protein [Rubrivivax sp.]
MLTLLGLAVVVAGWYGWRASPRTEGTLDLPGLKAEVRIERDAHGIPTIRAGSLEDALFGLGVVHAQDRLWQMETHRRIGAGRLAEAFGPPALNNDRFLRALGVRRAAQAQWERASADSRAALVAYTAGVNAVIARAMGARPPEFVLLGLQPEPWDPVDSLAWAVMMAWDLGGNWTTEMQRLRLSAKLPVARIDEFLPPYQGERAPVVRDYAALYRELGLNQGAVRQAWLQLPEIAPPSGVEGVGSNNWVLAGSRTTTGRPLLANDPHLGLNTPALWYFARLQAPGLDVAGATIPGLPGVVLGQNARLAWGFTNTGPDVQDLYIEEIVPTSPPRYRTPEGTAAFERFEETIRVRGGPDVKLAVRRTRHGPVISDAGTLDDALGARHVLAMRWTALDADSDVMATSLAMMRATSVPAFVQAAQDWVAPMQNMVVADADGTVAFVAAGRVPVRGPDNDLQGRAPAPGWEARYDWTGWVPAAQTPRERDPARGWIATANQRIHAPDYPHYLGSDWSLPYRQQRIEQLLEARPRHSIEDLARMQADVRSLAAVRLLPWLQRARPAHPLAEAAQRELAGFDGTMAADRAAPLVFWAWQRALARAVLADEAGSSLFDRSFSGRTFQDTLEGILERDDAWWCDDKTTPVAETCAQQVDRALAAALDELSARFGPEVSKWRWGDAHRVQAEHRPFSNVGALAPLFHLSVPVGGDTYTVNAMRVGLGETDARRYRTTHGPSLRALYDVADRSRSRVMHSSGQSGLPWAGTYRAFVQPWAEGSYVPLWPAGPDTRRGGTLLLKPAAD